MFPGLSTRIYNELAEIMTKRKYSGKKSQFNSIGLRVHDPPRRKNAVFIGGSFLAANADD
jgi:actin-related protein 2